MLRTPVSRAEHSSTAKNSAGGFRTGEDRRHALSHLTALMRRAIAGGTRIVRPAPDRIHIESIKMVYRNVAVGVIAAAVASIILAESLVRLQYTTATKATLFAGYISFCAALHVALVQIFNRYPERQNAWRLWGAMFSGMAFVEGIGWGWAPVGLVSGNNFDGSLLCLVVSIGCAAGSVPAFGPYLPAFVAFFLPSTIPFFLKTLGSAVSIEQVANKLLFLYVAGIGSFGFLLNRVFRNQIALRMHAQELADALKQQVAKVEAANRAKSTFLAAASHDLRQPVHALSLFAGALRGMPMSGEAKEILDHIDQSTQALDSLFAAILDISKLDAGIVPVSKKTFGIAPMLQRLCRESEDYAREKGLRIGVRTASLGCVAYCDPVLLERIVRNIITNAVRYTEAGRILVACRCRGGAVRIEVWDTGPGIPANELEAIFQEYYQLDNPARDRAKGLGLGLAIVRRLVSLLECDLDVRSRLGKGSVFSVNVPAARHAPIADEDIVRVDRPASAVQDRFIVVIDDEIAILSGMSTILRHWGFKVVVATSGEEAIEKLAEHSAAPDLIIADFRLRSSKSGIDAIEMLRAEYNRVIAAMLISGDTAPERLAEAHKSGLLLLHKPVANSRLRAAITNLLLSHGRPSGHDGEEGAQKPSRL